MAFHHPTKSPKNMKNVDYRAHVNYEGRLKIRT
jgi:hypothetical protein